MSFLLKSNEISDPFANACAKKREGNMLMEITSGDVNFMAGSH